MAALSAWTRSIQGLEKLGFPWILSSEMSLFNGLRAMFAMRIFEPPRSRGEVRAAAAVLAFSMRMDEIAHGKTLTIISGFLQAIVASQLSPPMTPPSSTAIMARPRSARLTREGPQAGSLVGLQLI